MQQLLTHHNLLKEDDLAELKSEIDKLEKVPSSLNSLKSKIYK